MLYGGNTKGGILSTRHNMDKRRCSKEAPSHIRSMKAVESGDISSISHNSKE